MSKTHKLKKLSRLQLLGLSISLLAMTVFTVFGIRWALSMQDADKLIAFQQQIASLGLRGWGLLLAIQYIQIVLAFIPGGPIQIVAGALYGPWGGMATSLLGTVLASATVFGLVHRYGRRIITLFVDEQDILRYTFISDGKRLEQLVLLLFIIPGTPKDALTYLFALTPLSMGRFMFLSILARIPGVLTSTLAGDSIIQGDFIKAGMYFAGITAISLGGMLLHKKVMAVYRHRK